MVEATERLAARHPGELIALVGHGGVMDVLGTAPPPASTFRPRAPGHWATQPLTGCSGRRKASHWSVGPMALPAERITGRWPVCRRPQHPAAQLLTTTTAKKNFMTSLTPALAELIGKLRP